MRSFNVLSVLLIASACGTMEAQEGPGGGGSADAAAPRADSAPRADAAPILPPCEGVNGPDGHCFFLSAPALEGAAAYASATLDCAEQGGAQLATVTTDAEHAFVIASFCPGGTCEELWIGLNDRGIEGTYVWADGSPFEFSAWGEGEPNNAGGGQGEDCVEYATQPVGDVLSPVWNDISCLLPRRGLCELD